jgi:hypothetical protein
VLIVGGGDGGSLQQVLRYESVEEAVVCELDQRVVDFSREFFAASFGDPWADPRSKLLIRDAFGYLEENPGQFDVIISDTTDPIGMAERLFSDEFYKLLVRALAPGRRGGNAMRTALLRHRVDQANLQIRKGADEESRLLLRQHSHLSRRRNRIHVRLGYTLGERT